MSLDEKRLLKVLGVGHETSMRGSGLSLRDALKRARYSEVRRDIDAQDLIPLIRAHRELVDQWLMYSQDKRTSGGWYITDDCEIGRVDFPDEVLRFASAEEAVAEYVLRELDFWTTV